MPSTSLVTLISKFSSGCLLHIFVLTCVTSATLPSLEDVQGGFNLQTTEDFDCEEFEGYQSQGVIKGDDFECKGSEEDPKTKDGASGAGNGSGSGSDDDEEGAAGRLTITALLGLSVAAMGLAL